jgi:DNA repair protein RadC
MMSEYAIAERIEYDANRLRADAGELSRIVSRAPKAELVATVFELARRCYEAEASRETEPVNRPKDAYARAGEIARSKKEKLMGLYLDSQNRILHSEVISIGALNGMRTFPREIFYPAIKHLALGVILMHNHPSGSLEPSAEDVQFTRAIKSAGETLGIELYDHLVVTGAGFTSLRERGQL